MSVCEVCAAPLCGDGGCWRDYGDAFLAQCFARGYQREKAAREKQAVALALVSGALCDSGNPVPEEARYGDAVRAVIAQREKAEAALREVREHLVEFGRHDDRYLCSVYSNTPCECGFRAAIERRYDDALREPKP